MFKNISASALGISGHQSEIIELALTYGFRGMDLNIEESAMQARLHGMSYARRLIDSANIQIGTFQLPTEWDTNDEGFQRGLEKLSEYAQVASEIGATRCVATIAPAGDKRPYHENFEFHKRRFSEICKVLEPFGIRLGIGFRASENLRKNQAFQFIQDFDGLLLLTNMVSASNLGVVLDVWDLHVGGSTAEKIQELSADQIVAVELADLPAEEIPPGEITEALRLVPGAGGRIDIPAILVALAEMGYDGPVTPKPSRTTLENTRRDAIVEKVGRAMGQMWKTAGLSPEGKLAATAES